MEVVCVDTTLQVGEIGERGVGVGVFLGVP